MAFLKPTFWQIPLVALDTQTALSEKTEVLKQRLKHIAENHQNARVASQKNCEKKPLKLRKLNSKIFSLF